MRMMYVVMRMCKPVAISSDWGIANAFMRKYKEDNDGKAPRYIFYSVQETPLLGCNYTSSIPEEKQPEFYRHLLRDINIFGIWHGLRIVLARCLQSHEMNLLLLKKECDHVKHIKHLENLNHHLLKLLKENNINVDI